MARLNWSCPGFVTFYRLYAGDGGDGRAMLGHHYRGRYLNGGDFVAGEVKTSERLAFRLPVGGDELPTPAAFGFFDFRYFNVVGCQVLPIGGFPAQAWVTPVMMAQGRFSVGLPATRIPVTEDP